MNNRLRDVLPQNGFTQTTVLVVGDLMLDRYIHGDVTRISPEAPVPVVSVKGEQIVAGGAANVALNVAGLGARTLVAGVVGDDRAGQRLKTILGDRKVDVRGVLTDRQRPTTRKTRVISGNHQIVRLDEEILEDLSPELSSEVLEQFRWLLNEGVNAVILSDYAKGVLGIELTQRIIEDCRAYGIPVLVDPKRIDYTPYAHATCITPNQKEFSAATAAMAISNSNFLDAGRQLREKVCCGTLLITQGANGMTLITSEQAHHFDAIAQEVYDVSGAGDTVIAVLTTALGSGFDLLSAVELANLAASIVVQHAGTSPICYESLAKVLDARTLQMATSHLQTPLSQTSPRSLAVERV